MKTITIPAAMNGTPGVYAIQMDQPGFCVVSTTAAFEVVMNDHSKLTASRSQNVGTQSGPNLGRITFFNSSAAAITAVIGNFGDARPTTIAANASTFVGPLSGQYDMGTSQPVAGLTEFPGFDTSGRERKIIYITNEDSTNKLLVGYVGPGGMTTIGIVYPKSTQQFETNADIVIQGTANHQTVDVFEVFYSNPLQTDQ